MPPSTRNVFAVMKLDSSEARKSTAFAISSGSANRPTGTCTRRRAAFSGSLANSSWSRGVLTGPGQSALTRTPWRGAHTPPPRATRRAPPLGRGVGDVRGARPHRGHERGGVAPPPAAAGQQVGDAVLAAQEHRRE